ncbi:MAG TPA: cation:proton antiporter [Vitreimonas sp.]|uniref:cation:proton antiporter n=1 Tax=Vitreimonas sp. TaxID=3069702 RepID=UPI002D453EFF|nr:cation:proton antiporter [Vitreimonas sp.]HYD86702.1 cation:proton antiporter [Vitreimonas sp.]
MEAKYALITTLVGAIVLAFVLGMIAQRFRLSPIVGYLLAGLFVGPYTPGFTGNVELALQLSEIGVILLMFGVGLKISVDDIWSVRWVAVPGSVVHTIASGALGFGGGVALGLPWLESLILGVSLSIASTIVFLRALEDRKLLKTETGRIGVSWLLIEDLLIVLAIVVLPALVWAMSAQGASLSPWLIAGALGVTFAKIAGFIALILVIGARVFPWLIIQIAHTKSRELLSLGTLALALGVAWAAYFWFDASFALGAFLGGLALNGTKFSHKVAEDSLPLRDTFAVLFFVAVGMLFDPGVLLRQPLAVAAIVAIVVAGKAGLAYVLMRWMNQPPHASVMLAMGLAQIGEFSFVLAGLGLQLEVMSRETYNLILAAALISIALNPFLLRLAPPIPVEKRAPEPAPGESVA